MKDNFNRRFILVVLLALALTGLLSWQLQASPLLSSALLSPISPISPLNFIPFVCAPEQLTPTPSTPASPAGFSL